MRRLCGPCGGAARQDVLVAADMHVSSGPEIDYETRVAHRNAEREGRNKKREDGDARNFKNKVEGDGPTLNGFNRRDGIRNRCYECGSENHSAPKCPLRDSPGSESVP